MWSYKMITFIKKEGASIKISNAAIEAELNKLGLDGWEAYGFVRYNFGNNNHSVEYIYNLKKWDAD